MNRKLEVFISIVINVLTFGVTYLFITLTNRQMTEEDNRVEKLKKATYIELKRKMLSVKWEYKCNYPNSLFDAEDYWNNLFHAGIIRFGDVGYILTTYGYIRAFYLQKKIRKGFTGCCKTKPYIK